MRGTGAKRDSPERACIQEAERLNAAVFQVSGAGLLDTLVAYKGALYWVEVKRPGEPLKPRQEKVLLRLHLADVPGYIVERPEDMCALLEGRLTPWAPGVRAVEGKKQRKHRPGHSRAERVEDLCATDCCPRSRLPGLTMCAMCAGKGKR